MQNCHFPCKIALYLKKVCYKVSLCEYCQQERHSLASLSAQKWLVGDVPWGGFSF